MEVVRALLTHSTLPHTFWSLALQTAVYLINRMPTPVLGKSSPFELLFGSAPNYLKLRIFGCLCFPWLRPYTAGKLDPPSRSCIFVGYCTSQSTYRCYDPATGQIFISRHVRFVEDRFPGIPPGTPSSSEDTSVVISLPFPPPPLPDPSPPALPSSNPIEVEPPAPAPIASAPSNLDAVGRVHQMRTRSQNNIHKPKRFFTATKHPLPNDTEPTSVKQALSIPHWRSAMDEEFQALQRHGTWRLVPKPDRANIIGCKWVFRTKRKPDGTIDKFKARLVAKGFHQRPGIDFNETFSPVIKPATIRTVLTLALKSNWSLRQLDVSNAFLHGTLDIPVYMSRPPSFKSNQFPSHVCLL